MQRFISQVFIFFIFHRISQVSVIESWYSPSRLQKAARAMARALAQAQARAQARARARPCHQSARTAAARACPTHSDI